MINSLIADYVDLHTHTHIFCLALDALVDVLGSHFFLVGDTYELFFANQFFSEVYLFEVA